MTPQCVAHFGMVIWNGREPVLSVAGLLQLRPLGDTLGEGRTKRELLEFFFHLLHQVGVGGGEVGDVNKDSVNLHLLECRRIDIRKASLGGLTFLMFLGKSTQ